MTAACPICEQKLISILRQNERLFYECPSCRPYSLTEEAAQDLTFYLNKRKDSRALLSYSIHRMSREKTDWPLVTTSLIENILKTTELPSHTEQLDNFLLWAAEATQTHGRRINKIPLDWLAAVGCVDSSSFIFIVQAANEMGLVTGGDGSMRLGPEPEFLTGVQLTFSGWSRVDEIRRNTATSFKAFMAMKFGDSQTDALFKDHFKAAVKATGFDLVRLDEEPRAGLIDDRLRVEIRQSRFLIADLTHHNNGAYWEAGFAEGLGKPVIYTCNKAVFEDKTSGGTHFDTNHHLTVIWDPANLGEAVEQLKATIRATLPEVAKLSDD